MLWILTNERVSAKRKLFAAEKTTASKPHTSGKKKHVQEVAIIIDEKNYTEQHNYEVFDCVGWFMLQAPHGFFYTNR